MRSLLLGFILIAACGSSSKIGGTCSSNGDCQSGLMCNTAIAGGYCTKSCTTVASTTECPADSICDSLSGGAGNGCEQICTKQSDCRDGLECDGVSGSNVKACKAKSPGVPDAGTTD
jgi:hypothetical protein